MFLNDMHYLVQLERQKDFLREAERLRLAQLAEQSRTPAQNARQQAAVWLGDRFVKWGGTLQRYGAFQPSGGLQIGEDRLESSSPG